MQARMKNPALVIEGAIQPLMALGTILKKGEVPAKTLSLVHLRASQINGCSVCVDMHARELMGAGETQDRLMAVAAWRDAPYFTDAERAALALTEAVTRVNDRSDAVPDEVWEEAVKHFNEQELAILVLSIGVINFFNRVNIATRQVAGEWVNSAEAKAWRKQQEAIAS